MIFFDLGDTNGDSCMKYIFIAFHLNDANFNNVSDFLLMIIKSLI